MSRKGSGDKRTLKTKKHTPTTALAAITIMVLGSLIIVPTAAADNVDNSEACWPAVRADDEYLYVFIDCGPDGKCGIDMSTWPYNIHITCAEDVWGPLYTVARAPGEAACGGGSCKIVGDECYVYYDADTPAFLLMYGAELGPCINSGPPVPIPGRVVLDIP